MVHDYDSISVLGLRKSIEEGLIKAGILTVRQLTELTPIELRQKPGIQNQRDVTNVVACLAHHGRTLKTD